MNEIQLVEKGLAPDWLIRLGIRKLLRQRLTNEAARNSAANGSHVKDLITKLDAAVVAVETEAANKQHYEVPASFFNHVLGEHMKYSCCYFATGNESLTQAEREMLRLTCERGRLEDGMNILDLGCGWGALTIYIAENYPECHVTALCNSHSQCETIRERAIRKRLTNISLVTSDINRAVLDSTFDRVFSIEMFEHIRNYRRLLKTISTWMKPDGRLFVHIFTHRRYPYIFESNGKYDWMGRYFFSGGIMPSDDLLLNFQDTVELEKRWTVNGSHYARTADRWLDNMDFAREELMEIFAECYGARAAKMWFRRWRLFFMACSELWGYRNGHEWRVCHYLFRKKFELGG